MVYSKGRRGKSKADVRLSVDNVCLGEVSLVMHVWENKKITHSFNHFDRATLEHIRNCADMALRDLDRKGS